MLDGFASLGGWAWVVLGLVLIGAEMLAPGIFLLWLGLAALLTGLVVGLTALSWQGAWLVFAALSIASVVAGRLITRRKEDEPDAARGLNARGRNLVGRVFRLEQSMIGGEGRLRIDDSSWRIIGPDLLAGAQIRVVRVEGATLVVEAA
ncbi:NfeD family protein [Bosea sp. TWI1241]|uniref:NfeD family protein n=1 Tax=Bosea sp. TWI1241 TaxID=3148904 RepID=UPI0032089060